MKEGHAMIEQMKRLRQEMESLGEAVETRLGGLRTEMREGFARQGEHLNELREGFARQGEHLNELREGLVQLAVQVSQWHEELAQQALSTTALGRDLGRQGASFDQAMAGMQDDFSRSRRAQTTIWTTLIERTAEMAVDVGDLKRDTGELRRRMDALEQRLAG